MISKQWNIASPKYLSTYPAKNQKTTSEAGFKKSKSESDRRHRIKSLGRFGGLNQDKYVNSCECIDIKAENSNWNYIKIEKEFKLDPYFVDMGIIHFEHSKFLLVGTLLKNESWKCEASKYGIFLPNLYLFELLLLLNHQ